VLLGVLLILAVGYWAMQKGDEPALAPGDTPAGESGDASGGDTSELPPGSAGVAGADSAGGPAPAGGERPVEGGQAGSQQAESEPPDGEQLDGEESDGELAQQWETATDRSGIDRSGSAAETMLLTIYYLDDQTAGQALQPVEIKVPATITPVAEAVRHLLHPPVELGLYGEFPPGTTASPPNLVDHVVTVELSPEVEAVRGAAATQAVIASLVYTLTEIPGVDAVQLWVNGRPAELDGFVWSEPLGRSDLEAWNQLRIEPVISYSGA